MMQEDKQSTERARPIRTIYECSCAPGAYILWNDKEGHECRYKCELCGGLPSWFKELLEEAKASKGLSA